MFSYLELVYCFLSKLSVMIDTIYCLSENYLNDSVRQEKEAELRLLEEATALRVEEAIRKKVEEAITSDEVKQRIMKKFEDGKKRLFDNVNKQLELEKIAALDEARKKEVKTLSENTFQLIHLILFEELPHLVNISGCFT